ncbi:sulfotransferase family 2 domain-containing protein [Propylenella binzhouense]|uniref:Sulfotransferase family protein n=1 Tax=Propylenella binzhouense TaxID=2555902 RepID=A0A964T8G3_9HYPH|nr:sulfotransferase family 2 domain-containing protein [Propylenella binzhouense]MYZ50400.1 hypothetical protein [Propylenella binzhouense]
MVRTFRYSAASDGPLSANPAHAFAARHALRLYRADAVYTMIPKNACSTMRLSLAKANGCVGSAADFFWIHANNDTFSADLPSLARARYTFVFLRCPFRRLASAYLDKMVAREPPMWQLLDLDRRAVAPADLTFRTFVRLVTRKDALRENHHWRPQVDFLVYDAYDDWFRVEAFAAAAERLAERTGIEILDARGLTRHGTETYRKMAGDPDLPPLDILLLQRGGESPDPATLYDGELVDRVGAAYGADVELYRSLFGPDALMFPA